MANRNTAYLLETAAKRRAEAEALEAQAAVLGAVEDPNGVMLQAITDIDKASTAMQKQLTSATGDSDVVLSALGLLTDAGRRLSTEAAALQKRCLKMLKKSGSAVKVANLSSVGTRAGGATKRKLPPLPEDLDVVDDPMQAVGEFCRLSAYSAGTAAQVTAVWKKHLTNVEAAGVSLYDLDPSTTHSKTLARHVVRVRSWMQEVSKARDAANEQEPMEDNAEDNVEAVESAAGSTVAADNTESGAESDAESGDGNISGTSTDTESAREAATSTAAAPSDPSGSADTTEPTEAAATIEPVEDKNTAATGVNTDVTTATGTTGTTETGTAEPDKETDPVTEPTEDSTGTGDSIPSHTQYQRLADDHQQTPTVRIAALAVIAGLDPTETAALTRSKAIINSSEGTITVRNTHSHKTLTLPLHLYHTATAAAKHKGLLSGNNGEQINPSQLAQTVTKALEALNNN